MSIFISIYLYRLKRQVYLNSNTEQGLGIEEKGEEQVYSMKGILRA